MTTSDRAASQHQYSGGAVGLIAFAGILMVLSGSFHALQGIVALANDKFFVVGKDYVFEFDTTGWGWIHLIAGIVVALAGIALFRGSTWARTVAVIVACLSIIASFLWMPFYPFWNLTVIAFDIFVIWAVTMHGRDITEP
ncbi:MAG TPA: hypothetical protein VFT31_10925 [Kribbella sp.]|nr:hypothetical protein [Kribbella sp.]